MAAPSICITCPVCAPGKWDSNRNPSSMHWSPITREYVRSILPKQTDLIKQEHGHTCCIAGCL